MHDWNVVTGYYHKLLFNFKTYPIDVIWTAYSNLTSIQAYPVKRQNRVKVNQTGFSTYFDSAIVILFS